MLILPDLPLSGSDCGWASIGVLREIRSDADSLAWWARLSRDDDRWSRVPLAPIFSISFWPRLLRVRLRRENVFSRFPFFLSSLLSSLSDSMDVLLLLPLRDDAEDATLQPAEKEEFPPTSSARSWATLVWRTTSMAWGSKEEFSLPQPKLWKNLVTGLDKFVESRNFGIEQFENRQIITVKRQWRWHLGYRSMSQPRISYIALVLF